MNSKAYEYALNSIHSKEVPKYVKIQCKEFLKIANGKNEKYYLNEEKVKQIENVLKLDTTLEEKGRKLIVKSNNRGGTDNISVVMLECGGE